MPRRTTFDLGPYHIHALDSGTGGREVLLLHGLSGSSRWWRRNLGALAEHFRVLAPDVIGFGRSRFRGRIPPPEELAAVLAEWTGQVAEGAVDLVGHSMGGQIAIHLAARFPERVRRLVLVDSAGIPRRLTPWALTRFAMELAPPTRWGDPTFLPVIAGDALSAGPGTLLRALAHVVRDDVRPLLPLIRARTLIVWGERDTVVPRADAEEFRAHILHARLTVIPGAAHNPMIDRPAEFNRVLLRFLLGNGEEG